MIGIREDPGDKRRGVEGATMGSENRSGGRVGGVVGPAGEWGVWPEIGSSGECE